MLGGRGAGVGRRSGPDGSVSYTGRGSCYPRDAEVHAGVQKHPWLAQATCSLLNKGPHPSPGLQRPCEARPLSTEG